MSGPTKQEIRRIQMETMVCQYLDKSCSAMYDIGVGPKTEYQNIQTMMPWIRLYGCEPDARLHAHLEKHFHGILWPVAIHSSLSEVTLHQIADEKQSSLFRIKRETREVTVEAWTLDRFDEACGKPDGILLWMDIEGSELDALRSGMKLLSSGRVHAINLEVRDDVRGVEGWCTADEVESFLNQMGYVIKKEYNDQKTHRDVIYLRRQS